MSEWLRRQTRNLLGYACAGSNPAVDATNFILFTSKKQNKINTTRPIIQPLNCKSLLDHKKKTKKQTNYNNYCGSVFTH